MLEVQHLSKSFGGVKAADDITLSFADGSLTAVRSTSIAAARSRGGPKTPGPASCIAP